VSLDDIIDGCQRPGPLVPDAAVPVVLEHFASQSMVNQLLRAPVQKTRADDLIMIDGEAHVIVQPTGHVTGILPCGHSLSGIRRDKRINVMVCPECAPDVEWDQEPIEPGPVPVGLVQSIKRAFRKDPT